jgi:hypothetical protein
MELGRISGRQVGEMLRRGGGQDWGQKWNGNEQTPSGTIMDTHLYAYLGCIMEEQGLNMDESSC